MKMIASISRPHSHFSVEVESLRGIAALLVVVGHFYLFAHLTQYLQTDSAALRILISGLLNPQPPVLLFFTISGLALGRQLRKEPVENPLSFIAYICRRVFRLVPLMWAATLFAFILNYFRVHEAHLWQLYATLFLQNIELNISLWSLRVELLCSIFFPILFWALTTTGKTCNTLLFISFAVLSYFWQKPIFLQFFTFFYVGLLVDSISTKFKERKKLASTVLFVFFILVFILAPEFSIGPRNAFYGCWQSWVLPEILACSFILFFIIHKTNSGINRFLQLRAIRYLGKISFSIYLFHFPLLCLMLAKIKIGGFYSLMGFGFGYFTLVILIASATYRWIELPSNKFGKKLAIYISKRESNNAVNLEPGILN